MRFKAPSVSIRHLTGPVLGAGLADNQAPTISKSWLNLIGRPGHGSVSLAGGEVSVCGVSESGGSCVAAVCTVPGVPAVHAE